MKELNLGSAFQLTLVLKLISMTSILNYSFLISLSLTYKVSAPISFLIVLRFMKLDNRENRN